MNHGEVPLQAADTNELCVAVIAPVGAGQIPWNHVALPLVLRQLRHASERLVAFIAREPPRISFLLHSSRFNFLALQDNAY